MTSTTATIPEAPVVPWAKKTELTESDGLDPATFVAQAHFPIPNRPAEDGVVLEQIWDLTDGRWVPAGPPAIIDARHDLEMDAETAGQVGRALVAAADRLEEILTTSTF